MYHSHHAQYMAVQVVYQVLLSNSNRVQCLYIQHHEAIHPPEPAAMQRTEQQHLTSIDTVVYSTHRGKP
jgi:hypothetical protein